MQIIAKRTSRAVWAKHPRAELPLREWYTLVDQAEWSNPTDVRLLFGRSVDFVGDNRIVFDIRHNEFRLIVQVAYAYRRVLIKVVGTRAEYDRFDPETV